MKEPTTFFDTLINEYNFKLKGVGPPTYHLGGNFGRDQDGTLFISAKTYIGKMVDNYERMFGVKPKKVGSPAEAKDSPELDTSPFLEEDGKKQYQSLIGALQWCITLGQFDIAVAVMTLSRFRVEPRQGHLDRAKQVVGYLRKHPEGAIRFRVYVPSNEDCFQDVFSAWRSRER